MYPKFRKPSVPTLHEHREQLGADLHEMKRGTDTLMSDGFHGIHHELIGPKYPHHKARHHRRY